MLRAAWTARARRALVGIREGVRYQPSEQCQEER
jgi:hypothetical protein